MTPAPQNPEGSTPPTTASVRVKLTSDTPNVSSPSTPLVSVGARPPVPVTAPPRDLSNTATTGTSKPVALGKPAAASDSLPVKAALRTTRVVRTFGERCEIVLTSLPTLWTVGLTSVALILWVLVAELPRTFERRLVSARTTLDETQKAADEAAQHEAIDHNVLSNQVVRAQRFLIPAKDQIVTLASEIEKMGKASGLQTEMSTLPGGDRGSIVPQVIVHSSLLRIQVLTQKGSTNDLSLFPRLLPLLDKIDQLTNKVEITALSVAADRNGSASAQLELQFWIRKSDEKDSRK